MKYKIPGFAVTIGLLVLEIPVIIMFIFTSQYWEKQKNHYYSQGVLQGMADAASAINQEFGETSQRTSNTVFSAKDRSIVSITINNVKTIREYHDKNQNDN